MYNLNLPGFSVEEFKENLKFRGIEHTGFTNKEIEDGLNNLLKEKIFEIVIEYDDKPRYVIVDQILNLFIKKLLFLTEDIKNKMYLVWTFIRRPTKDDIKWLELFIGIKDTEEKLNELREHRKSFKKNKIHVQQAREDIYKMEKKINEFINLNKKEFSDIIERFVFPCNEMLGIIYPKHFQKVLIS